MNRTIIAPGGNSHTHRCMVCDTQIPCDSPEDAGQCEMSALTCAPCEEDFRDQDSGEPSDDQERARLGDDASDDDFDEMIKGEDQMGNQMLEDSQAIADSPVAAAQTQVQREATPRGRPRTLRADKRRRF